MKDPITAKQYEAIGRLSVAFNELELSIEVLLVHTIGSSEWSVASLIGEGEGFARKVRRFREVLLALKKERPEFSSAIDSVVKVLQGADDVALKRNAYVHARPLYGTPVGDSKIITRKSVVPGNETDLLKVVDEI